MTSAPEFVQIDEQLFFIGPVLAAAGLQSEFFQPENMNAIMEAGEAFQYDDDPNAVMLQYPSAESGVAMLLDWDGDAYGLMNAWPFLPRVISAEIEPLKIEASPDQRQGFVTARIGAAAIVFFDDGFVENAPRYRDGRIVYAQFYGTITQASPASEEDVRIGPGEEGYDELLAAGKIPDDGGAITISWADTAGMMPRFDIAPNAFEFRGPVTSINSLTDWLVPDAAIVQVTVMRPFIDEEGNQLDDGFDLPMLIRPDLIEGGNLPKPGDELQGLVYIYGTGFDDDEGDDGVEEPPLAN